MDGVHLTPAVENQELFLTLLRDSLRTVAEQMLLEEVATLCGASHYPQPGATYRRAGSERGTCHAGGHRETILRPRVRKQVGDGTETEHGLASYAAMRRSGNNAVAVVTALGAGMSTRSQEWASEGVISKSAASRHWIETTAAKITALRERDLRKMVFFGLMLAGVFLGDGAGVVIALGLLCPGEKVLLDFEVGASENAAVCTALVARLQRRGFGPPAGSRLLAVLDGAAGLAGRGAHALAHRAHPALRRPQRAQSLRLPAPGRPRRGGPLVATVAPGPRRSRRSRSARRPAELPAPAQCRRLGQSRRGRRAIDHLAPAQRPGHPARLAPVHQRDRERHAQLPRPDRQGLPLAT